MSIEKNATEFELLYGQALDSVKAFPEYQFKTVAALSVIIGWLVTSEGAQNFVKAHAEFTLPGAALAFGVLIVLKTLWFVWHYRRMKEMYERLLVLAKENDLESTVVEVFRPGRILSASYLLVNVVLSLVGIFVVYLISRG